MTQRISWLKTRRQLLTQIKRQVRHRLGPEPLELQDYVHRYNREFRQSWRAARDTELKRAIRRAEVVLGADFHAFSQSQRIHLRLMRDLIGVREMVLVLEAVPARFQSAINRFLAGNLSESGFLKAVAWEKNWGFPWENYRPLFDFARENGVPVFGLDQGGVGRNSLARRDRLSAKQVIGLVEKFPKALVYVIVGDLHLANAHLPYEMKAIKPQLKVVKVLQNSEHLYFRLAKRGQEHRIETMTSGRDRFCVLSSPPWVKWQSYLIFLEQKYDHDQENDPPDLTEEVTRIGRFLAGEIQVKVDFSRLHVSSLQEPDLWQKYRSRLTPKDRSLFDTWVARERSFLLPQSQQILLARHSLNHLTSLAGQFIHATLSRRKKLAWGFPQDLVAQIWIESIGYFFSKLVNHRRKTESFEQLKAGFRTLDSKAIEAREVLRLVLAQKLTEHSQSGLPPRTRVRERASYLEAARLVGGQLGEELYEAYRSGKITPAQLRQWLKFNPVQSDFRIHYLKIVRTLRRGQRGLR